MGKKYIGGFTDGYGFKRTSNKPIDDSAIVEFIADLTNGTIEKPYPMMEVGVLENLTYYSWNGNDISLIANWIPRGTGGSSNAAITTDGTVPALAPPITAAQIRSLIGAGTMSKFLLAVDSFYKADILDSEYLNLVAGNAMDVVYSSPGGIKTVTISFERSVTESATGGSVALRTSTGLLVATGVAIAGGSNPLFILRGDGSVSAITKAEIDALLIDANRLNGRWLNFAPSYDTVVGRSNIDGSISSWLFNLVKAQETVTPSQANTVTMGVPGANNYHSLRNVPISLFKQWLTSTDWNIGSVETNTLRYNRTSEVSTPLGGTILMTDSSSEVMIKVPLYYFKAHFFGALDTAWVTLPVTSAVSISGLEYRRKNGRVLVRGGFEAALTGSHVIATLPVGFRPVNTELALAFEGGVSMKNTTIGSSGAITVDLINNASYSISLDIMLNKNSTL